MYKLYSLNCPDTNTIRYVGYTSKEINQRLKEHIYDSVNGNSHKRTWIRSLIKKGKMPTISLLLNRNTLNEILIEEVNYISKYENLTNSTTGGERSKKYTSDVLLKMSINRKGKCVGKDNPMFGVKRPDLSIRNNNVNPISVKKMSDTLRLMYSTDKYKNILRRSQPTCKIIYAIKDKKETEYESKRQMAKELNLDRKSINMVLNGKYSQHKGYTFRQ